MDQLFPIKYSVRFFIFACSEMPCQQNSYDYTPSLFVPTRIPEEVDEINLWQDSRLMHHRTSSWNMALSKPKPGVQGPVGVLFHKVQYFDYWA